MHDLPKDLDTLTIPEQVERASQVARRMHLDALTLIMLLVRLSAAELNNKERDAVAAEVSPLIIEMMFVSGAMAAVENPDNKN